MGFKVALVVAFVIQLAAAILALRLNFRYRIYSAWFFVSAAASVGAILRLTTLFENWNAPPTFESDWVQWGSAFAALISSILLLGGMSFIEPFFKEMVKIQENQRSELKQLASIVKETEEELRLAQRIQRQLLPSKVPVLPHMDIFGRSDPAEWTSGDYFDYLTLQDGSLALVVADVSGHGLGPALLMSSTRASFRGIAPSTCDVADLLTSGNRAVADAVSASDFVTALAVQYDHEQHRLTYAAAGHVGYLLKSQTDSSSMTSVTLPAESPPLGILEDLAVESQTTPVAEGDILIMITDGILETRNDKGEMFGERLLLETVESNRHESAESIVSALLTAVHSFAEAQPQHDDNTAVVVKFI